MTGFRSLVPVTIVILLLTAGCAGEPSVDTATPRTATSVVTSPDFESAVGPEAAIGRSITVLGRLEPLQKTWLDWALARFELAGLALPPVIEVVYDPGRTACDGTIGRCHLSNGCLLYTSDAADDL